MVRQLPNLLVIKYVSPWFIDPLGGGAEPRKDTLAFWTFPPNEWCNCGITPITAFQLLFQLKFHLDFTDLLHELRDNADTHAHNYLDTGGSWEDGLWDLALIFLLLGPLRAGICGPKGFISLQETGAVLQWEVYVVCWGG